MKKGQVSIEYLVVLGFLMLFIVPLLVLYSQTQKDTQDQLNEAQARRVGNLLRDAAERVYFAGDPAQETLQVYLPDKIESITLSNTSIVYTIRGGARMYDLYIPSIAPLNGTLLTNKGVHVVTVRATQGVVTLSE